MVSTDRSVTGTMAPPDRRVLRLATYLFAATLIVIPWADGGRSPAGQAAVVLLMVLAGAAGFLTRASTPSPSPWLALATIMAGMSAVQTIHPDRTIQALLLLVAYVIAGTLAARVAREDSWAERVLLNTCALSGLLVVGVGLIWLFRGNDGGLYASALIGPFGYPNALAGFTLLAGGAAVATLQPARSRVERALAVAALAACLVGLYCTKSRGALIAAVVGLVCWALVQRQLWWPRRWLWLTVAALALLAGLSLTGNRLSTLLPLLWPSGPDSSADTSVQWRLSILQWTWAMIRDHPWVGVGPGAFPVALIHYQQMPYVSGENPHNLYLEVAAEYGVAAGLLVSVGLLVYLARIAVTVLQLPLTHPGRSRRAALMAALVAFFVHSGMDLDWSFPAVALLGAVILGLANAERLTEHPRRPRKTSLWRTAVLLMLMVASILALTRYYSATLVAWGRDALAGSNLASAERSLRYASYLNPLSFTAHYWLARVRLQAGDPRGALEAAEQTVRTAPADPNSHALVGEMALAVGRPDMALSHFQRAVDAAPAAHLRFYAGVLDAAFAAGKTGEALHAYTRAAALFTNDRVLGREGRCLAPGDRYLLARMSRVAARLSASDGHLTGQQTALSRADLLSEPDTRGVCATRGRAGQTSPEAAVVGFWRAWSEAGLPAAERYLLPGQRPARGNGSLSDSPQSERARQVRVDWIHSLSGGEHRATVVYQLKSEGGDHPNGRCASTAARFTREGWFLESLPSLDNRPCSPQK
jgi:putative inorganic carbon (hco3(-)) transporter